jgi:putative copper export protein
MSGDAFADVLLIASRLLWYGGCLGVIGAGAFRLFILPAVPPTLAQRERARAAPAAGLAPAMRPTLAEGDHVRAAASAGLVAAVVLLAGTLARLYAQAYALFGLDEPVTAGLILEVATDLPPWSRGWTLQLGAAVVSVAALATARAGIRWGWPATYVVAAAVAASAPLTGHAVAQPGSSTLPIAMQIAHILGAGVWIGGLLVMFVVALSSAEWRAGGASRLPALLDAFSPMALSGAGVLVLSGLITMGLYLHAPSDLWTSSYGRVLFAKVLMVGGVAVAGFVNWRRVGPRVSNPGGLKLLRMSITVELMLGLVVLLLTALVVSLPQP